MATAFSTAFVRLRTQAGFETAYQFFHKNGGHKVLECSFPNYLRIEKGSHLPQPRRLPRLCALLRLPLGSNDLRGLIGAYLETWLGKKELLDWMLGPWADSARAAAPQDPAQAALSKVVHESAKPVSLAQYEAVMSSAAAYWCFRVLTTSKEAHRPEELAALTGLGRGMIQKALALLARHRVAKPLPDGRWRSPLAGAFLVFPDSSVVAPEFMEKVFRYNEDMVKRRGRLVDVRYCGVRADALRLEGFVPYFREAIRGVNAYAVTEKTEQSGLFFVEGRIYKLLDF